MTDLGVVQLIIIVMPQLSVVGVTISLRPPAVHCSNEAMSSVLMSGIASCRVGFVVPVGESRASGWAIGIVTGGGIDYWTSSNEC